MVIRLPLGSLFRTLFRTLFFLLSEILVTSLTHLGLQSHFGDKPLKFQVVCPQNGTAVLKGLTFAVIERTLSEPHC